MYKVKHQNKTFIVDAKSAISAVNKLRITDRKSVNVYSRKELKQAIQNWNKGETLEVIVDTGHGLVSIFYYPSKNGYYSIPTGITNAITETNWEQAKQTALKYVDNIVDSNSCSIQQYFTDKIEKAENVGKFTLWKDEEGYYYLDATISRSGKRLQRLNTKDINEARKKAKEMLEFVEDKSVFSEETMSSMQEGIEKDYENMDKRLSELHDATSYGITPLFKWKKGNKKPERIASSLDEARYVKNSLERNDGISYVIFEIDTFKVVY